MKTTDSKKRGKKKTYRSAITGRKVSAEYAAKNPDVTISESVRPRK